MKQKLQRFRKEIRAHQINQYFERRRKELFESVQSQEDIQIEEEKPNYFRQRIENNKITEIYLSNEFLENQQDIIESWNIQCQTISNKLSVGDFVQILSSLNEINRTFKKIKASKNIKKKSNQLKLFQIFLKLELLPKIVQAVLLAFKANLQSGLLQNLSIAGVQIMQRLIFQQPIHFSESIFIESNIGLFLKMCLSEPMLNQSHLNSIICIMTHMIFVSVRGEGKLFSILNNPKNPIFNIQNIFFNLTKIELYPENKLTINFIILIKNYLLEIQSSFIKNKNQPEFQAKIIFSKNEISMCAQIASNSFNFYSLIDFNEMEHVIALQESLQVLRLLIEFGNLSSKLMNEIRFDKMIEMMILGCCPYEIKETILMIIDHVIYIDKNNTYAYEFVKSYGLVQKMWGLKKHHQGYVFNILTNLASEKIFRSDIEFCVHNIFLCFQFTQNNLLFYHFIYNWFYSQNFEIEQSRDHMIIDLLKEKEENNPEIIEIQIELWYSLFKQGGFNRIPQRILEIQQNEKVREIREKIKQQDWQSSAL